MTEPDQNPAPPSSVASDRFILEKLLGKGGFGEVWLGKDINVGKTVAVKLEVKGESKQLANEYEILSNLKRPTQQQGFTEIFHFGREGLHICLVMELLGQSLDQLLEVCNGKFNTKTVALLGEQILRRFEYLHSKSIIHRDVKPENLMMGLGSRCHIVYLIDFGLSEPYYDEGRHAMPIRDTLTGTARYSSISAHDKGQSRRDDLEAIGHMLVFFLRGSLPWSGLPSPPQGVDEFTQIRDVKKSTKVSELCRDLPPEIEEYIAYCRGLTFKQRPDYKRLRALIQQILQIEGNPKEHELQWLEDNLECEPEPLSAWPDIAQPDDAIPETTFCGCLKRRQRQPDTPKQELNGARDMEEVAPKETE